VRLLARVPIRLRLTLAFAIAMAVVLLATGLFLYLRLEAALDQAIDQSLRGRADDVAALVRVSGFALREEGWSRLVDQEANVAQVLDPNGVILDSTPGVGGHRLLTDPQLARAAQAMIMVDRPLVPGFDDPLRLLATPVQGQDGPVVVIVGASVEEQKEALESLLAQMLLGGPIVLLLASLLGYSLAAATLRPVESMRREAEAVSAAKPGRRLPLPPADDEIARLGRTLNTMLGRLESALAQSGSSSRTPAMSCAPPSRRCGPSLRSRCGASVRQRRWRRRCGRPRRRPNACAGWPKIFWCWPGPTTAACLCARSNCRPLSSSLLCESDTAARRPMSAAPSRSRPTTSWSSTWIASAWNRP